MNEYVLLVIVKLYTKRFFGLLIQGEIAVKVTKRKALIGKACGATNYLFLYSYTMTQENPSRLH